MADGEAARYRAFISYSHADAAFGRRLHRRLEAYAVPGRLANRPGVPRRLTPIFRDLEELSAAGDLSAQVRAALEQSAALVVVCSPRAAASPWVAREVALFRELHPDRPVLAALIEGEPDQAFPEALTRGGVEPLAADFRDGRDGEKLALLKLVAGIVGVGLDELVQRDAQRNLQRVTAVTAGAVAGMVAMGGLAFYALAARAEAERQRTEAEGLVEFMITDLRTRLEGVGRLDVMTAVNRRALKYYEGRDLKGLSTPSLLRRAEIVTAMGQDDVRRNDLARAEGQFLEARRTTGALLAVRPNDPDRIFSHAQSEYWVAFIAWRRGDIDAALVGMKRYAALTRRLLEIDAGKPEWRMEAGYAESNLGTIELLNPDHAATAEAAFVRSLGHFQAAARAKAADPEIDLDAAEIQAEIADAHGWIADSRRTEKRYAAARESRREEARILMALQAADPKNRVYAYGRQANSLAQARIDLADGKAEAAVARLREAWSMAKALAAADPDDGEHRMQRIATGAFLAKALLIAGDSTDEARRALAECDSETARKEVELRDLCALVGARLARAENRSADEYVRLNRDRMAKVRRSQRWGIDFSSELRDVAQTQGEAS
jgi:hypothetical protein